MKTKLVTGYSKPGLLIGIFSLHFKVVCLLSVLLFGISLGLFAQIPNGAASTKKAAFTISEDEIEALVDSLSLPQLKSEVLYILRKKGLSTDLFSQYLDSKIQEDRIKFFRLINLGLITTSNVHDYVNQKKQSYIDSYNDFLLVKNQFELQVENNSVLAVNGPCTNIDFENGTTSGWQTSNANACKNPTPCNANFTGASRLQITNSTMSDPYIPGLSVVNPLSGNYSVRMEDYVNGGNATMMRQSFMVTATNNVFTYHYAAVLEDPQNNHNDNERPYFKVRMYDAGGNEIKCASYDAIAKPPINNFTHVSVTNPNAGLNNGAAILELYYRDWSTVSIPLLAYIGQNVTIEFSVSDCSKGAHLGYVYVDAECFELSPAAPNTICGNQTVTITATGGFAAYQWTGPGIIGSSTNQSVKVNKAGDYAVKFTPFADLPCPVSLSVKVLEHCNPSPITTTLCEDKSGTLTVNEVNLINYINQITAFHTPPGFVVSWHSGLPANAGNKLTTPTKVVVKNGDRFYAVINYIIPGSDTAEIKFTILPKPLVQQPTIPSVCIRSSPFQISGATPVGGIFSGTSVNSSGLFTPSTAGIFKIKYTYTNASGCIDSASQNVTVVPKPTVNAGLDQTICTNASSVSLSGSSTNSSSVSWNGTGQFTNSTNAITGYNPTTSELNSSSFFLTLTAKGIAPCASISDQVKISVQATPTVDAGPAQSLCSTNPVFNLVGTTSNSVIGKWTGGNGVYSNKNNSTTTYTASPDEINSGTVTLNYSVSNSISSCPGSTDNVVLTIIKSPIVEAGPSQQLCENVTSLQLTAVSSNSHSIVWSGGLGSFASPNSLSTLYNPTPAEISNGTITLKATAQGNSPCVSVEDNVTIQFIPLATVNAGISQKLCADTKSITLQGSASNYTDVKWSGGNGTYSTINLLQTIYTPTVEEKAAGTISFTLAAKAKAPCPNVSNNTSIQFIPAPTVDAGLKQTLCATSNSVSLNGTSSNFSSVQWSGGAGTFSNEKNLFTIYTPTNEEKLIGSVVLKLTALPNNPCSALNDEVEIKFDPIPKVIVPDNPTVCGNNSIVTLNGSIENASNAVWSGGIGLYSPSLNSLSITYTPTQQEISAGKVNLMLSSIKNSTCPAATASVLITIIPPPVVDAGEPITTCINQTQVILSGSVSGTTNYEWTSAGDGIFTSSTVLQTNYILSEPELKNGTIVTLTAYAPLCLPVSDNTKVTILPLPHPELGPDKVYCEGTSIVLSTDLKPGESYSWTKDNIPMSEVGNSISVIAVYGNNKYSINVIDKNNCQNKDSIIVKGLPMPVVSVKDTSTCTGVPTNLVGVISNYQNLLPFNPIINWQRNGVNLPNNNIQLPVMEPGNYTLTVNASDCIASDQATLTVHPLPVVTLPSSYTYCSDKEIGVIVDAGPGVHYLWDPGYDTTKVVTLSQPGIHKVTITNQFNCSASASTLIRDICPPRLFIGDAFSPDRDGVNDDYNVYGAHIGKFHMLIFNRWGEIIFESNDRLNPWNGIYKEELIPIGVYPWTITYEGDSEEYKGPYKMEGSVTVIR